MPAVSIIAVKFAMQPAPIIGGSATQARMARR